MMLLKGIVFGIFKKFPSLYPPPLLAQIKAINLCTLSSREDCVAWDSPDDAFNLRRAYFGTIPSLTQQNPSKWIWKTIANPRILFFLWQCYHNSVFVRGTLVSRGMAIPPLCPRCSHLVETLSHALRDCPDFVLFWNNISPPSSCLPSFLLPFPD